MRDPGETIQAALKELRFKVDVNSGEVQGWLARKAAKAPAAAQKAVNQAAAWWLRQAQPKIPVRGSVSKRQRKAGVKGSLYSAVGRGQLRKRTRVIAAKVQGGVMMGGIVSGTHYALWLMAGTRFIAGGRVLAWRPGQPLITDWPAKHVGPAAGSAGALPILVPWHGEARRELISYLKREL
jgi:hypothetical protein